MKKMNANMLRTYPKAPMEFLFGLVIGDSSILPQKGTTWEPLGKLVKQRTTEHYSQLTKSLLFFRVDGASLQSLGP